MTQSEDFEIEYLDEDEDVVQQCVQGSDSVTPAPLTLSASAPTPSKYIVQPSALESSSGSLLVERTPVTRPYKRKKPRKDEESDSDYDPTEDIIELENQRRNKKKMQTSTPRPAPMVERKPKVVLSMTKKEELKFRRSLGLKIPNFEDPLCLPVKAILKDESDLKKLKNWNNLCLNHYRNHDTALKPDVGATVGSLRTIVLRNVKNKLTGKAETTIWGKHTAHSTTGKKSEVFQSVLPKYREAKLLDFPMNQVKRTKLVRNVDSVVLTKEDDKGDVLVVYKPKEAVSAVYRLAGEISEEAEETKKEDEKKQFLEEITVCKLCAPCYQGSWRGFRKTDKKKSVLCAICKRSFVSVYNLLAHVKTHSPDDVRKHKRQLSKTLADVVEYHYKCRICQQKCASIKELRKHILTHQSIEQFQCEVCNRVTKSAYSM